VPDPTPLDREAAREATDAFKALVARIGEVFGILDLSFFVAGVVCFAALIFGAWILGAFQRLQGVLPSEWRAVHVGVVVLVCYVLGIVCFAAGRKLRNSKNFYEPLPGYIRDFGLAERYARFLPGDADADATRRSALLYTRLWAEVRQSQRLLPSFNLLTRYWVMAAMCDGLSAAFLVFWFLWVAWGILPVPVQPPSLLVIVIGAVGLGAGALLSTIEAQRYGKAQMYELVATLAHAHESAGALMEPPTPAPQEVPQEPPGARPPVI
jgi:hypothetical protein